MTSKQEGTEVLVLPAEEDGYFAIPLAEVERGRVSAEKYPELAELIEAGDVRGFSGGVLLPYYGESGAQGYYALQPEVIDQYRVPTERTDEMKAALEAALGEDDVRGYSFLPHPCPPGTHQVVKTIALFNVYDCVPNPRAVPTASLASQPAQTVALATPVVRWPR